MTELAHTDTKPQEIVAAMRTRLSAAGNAETALPQRRGIVFLFLAFFGAIVVKNLWITDDAYITFCTVDNFLHGYGLTWNTSERVQSEAGSHGYMFDAYALNDPLRARLPAASDWRIGHVARDIPAGYMETLKDGGNHIQDPDLAHYHDKLSLITRGNLFDFNRLVAIFKMNLGQYDYLLHAYDRRHPTSGTAGGAPPIWAAMPTSGYFDDRQAWPFEGIG